MLLYNPGYEPHHRKAHIITYPKEKDWETRLLTRCPIPRTERG